MCEDAQLLMCSHVGAVMYVTFMNSLYFKRVSSILDILEKKIDIILLLYVFQALELG